MSCGYRRACYAVLINRLKITQRNSQQGQSIAVRIVYSVKSGIAFISVADILRILSRNRLDAASVDCNGTAVACKAAADACRTFTSDCRNRAAVYSDGAAAAKISAADSRAVSSAFGNNVSAVNCDRAAVACRTAADSGAVSANSARCVDCARIYRERAV